MTDPLSLFTRGEKMGVGLVLVAFGVAVLAAPYGPPWSWVSLAGLVLSVFAALILSRGGLG